MADEFKIVASLDVPKSVQEINKDIPKLQGQSKHLKIIADLDPKLSIKNIQATLNKMNNNANIKIGIDTSGFNSVQGATQNITNSLKNVQTQAQQTVGSLTNLADEFKKPIKPVLNTNGLIDAEKTIEKVQKRFAELGNISVKGIYSDKITSDGLEKMVVNIKNAQGEVRTLTFQLGELYKGQKKLSDKDLFYLTNGTSDNGGIEKFLTSIQKAQDKLKALRIDLASTLKSIGTGYSDPNSAKPIVDDKHLESLNAQYVHALRTIAELKNADDTTMASMKANAEKEIDSLKRMVREYQNAEYAATSLRTKDISTIKTNQTNELNAFIAQINNAKIPLDTMTKDVEELKTALNGIGDKDSLTKFLNQFDNAKTKFESVKATYKTLIDSITQLQNLQNSSTFTKNASDPKVIQTKQEITQLLAEYQNLKTQMQGNITPAGLESIGNQLTQLNARFNTTTVTAQRFESELKNDNGAEKLAQRVALLKAQLEAYAKANPKAMKKFGDTFNSMIATLNSSPDKMNVDRVAKEFQTVRQEINKADLAGKTFFQNLKDKINKFTGWMSMTYAISLVTRTIRNMITEVVNLDTALIDLKKTFGGTDTDLKNLYISANKTAKELGVTTKDILEQASAWSRLGYSSAEAAETMAKNSAIFKTISPGMDLNTATDGLVSMMKAFDIEANDVLDGIMSKVNIIGNKFATDNSSIVEAMTRSSAAMAAANNTLEETIALNTASIEITRNAETTATAWRTVSMRLRGYDESTEELSDDLKNITGDIADLTKTASNGGKGISLFTDESRQTYKSTYEIIKEISKIWNELSDKNQAELLEKLAGKRNSQVVAAAIQNFATAEKAMDEMANSQGNAMSEMEIAYESISYKINQFKESIVGLGQTIFEQDALKWLIDRGTDIIEGLDTIIEKFGVLPTVLGGTAIVNAFKNVGEQQNTPSYALLQLCA